MNSDVEMLLSGQRLRTWEIDLEPFSLRMKLGWVGAGGLFQHRNDVYELATPANPNGQAETAVFVDHVEELEPPALSRGVELEVHHPDLVHVLSLVTSHRAVRRACPHLHERGEPLRDLLAPEPVQPLVVQRQAFPPQQALGHTPAPADVLTCDLAETMSRARTVQIIGTNLTRLS